MDMNEYMKTMAKPNWLLIISKVCLFAGGVLVFLSLFIDAPGYFYTVSIGGVLIIVYFVCKLIQKVKSNKSAKKGKVRKKSHDQKYKPVVATSIPGDTKKVLVVCPKCSKKIRVPNSNGKHGVKCPSCDTFFQVVIK